MLNRRDFLKAASAAGGMGIIRPIHSLASRSQNSAGFFNVHPFVERHPEAVFIMKTSVDVKTNSEAKLNAGLDFTRSVIIPADDGIPLTSMIPIKPNLTCSLNDSFSLESGMGIVTDANFVEGVIEGMKELGLSGSQFYIREVNCSSHFGPRGYIDMCERTGADIRELEAPVGKISENDLHWVDVPEGVWFRKIPYLWPINAPGSWLLNISKFKAHGMGLTLCCKNNQGSVAHNYQEFCGTPKVADPKHLNPNAVNDTNENYKRHKADGVPRWDKPDSALSMEQWCTRAVDNLMATKTGLCIVEGIYGRDGNGFHGGPNPEGNGDNSKGEAWDYMTNIIIFGKNSYHVDTVGHWLGGHEPGNFGLFHLGLERGFSTYLNPMDIPVYEWFPNGSATLTPLVDFKRTPLKTYYLQRDYNGQNEPAYHLCNEPFEYGPSPGLAKDRKPEVFVLSQSHPNPSNPNIPVEFSLPKGGNAHLEIYNASGQLLEVLADGYYRAGAHMAVWNTAKRSSGTYVYRLQFGDFTETKKMVLVK